MDRYKLVSWYMYLHDVEISDAGMWISFLKQLPNWRVEQYFYLPRQKTTGHKYRKGKWEEKKTRHIGE
jgi:hypothetical protein